MDLPVAPTCCCFWSCALAIFALFAVPFSFKSMEQGKYSVQLQWMSQNILDEVVEEPGVRFVGLGNWLIEFPSTFQTMYFIQDTRGVQALDEGTDPMYSPVIRGPIRARTEDGLEILVSMSFQWKLEPNALVKLYNILGETMYRDEFVRFARSAVIEACSYFPAEMYFTNRTVITTRMEEVLRTNFQQPEQGLEMQIVGLQLREVDLPDEFDDEIANTQEQMQEAEVAMAEREEQKIAAQRNLEVATKQVEEVIWGAEGEAKRVRLENEAAVTQLKLVQLKQAEANALILQQFENATDPIQRLFDLMTLRALSEHSQDKMMMSM
eukprot:TRINITY_DN52532_c0_g1_i1.p1 TRINITY_DN52532_c0_g1~~TRINITY_DN52532_c0_g1_i1.p1  ORF type:complete len:324 (+),score=86.71 TRINITY_DN52532_c0_g1_i1:68-1039(+)